MLWCLPRRFLWDAVFSPLGGTITVSTRTDFGRSYDQLAEFSSFGPTTDQRIKPDIVAPGILFSARTLMRSPDGTACTTSLQRMQVRARSARGGHPRWVTSATWRARVARRVLTSA